MRTMWDTTEAGVVHLGQGMVEDIDKGMEVIDKQTIEDIDQETVGDIDKGIEEDIDHGIVVDINQGKEEAHSRDIEVRLGQEQDEAPQLLNLNPSLPRLLPSLPLHLQARLPCLMAECPTWRVESVPL